MPTYRFRALCLDDVGRLLEALPASDFRSCHISRPFTAWEQVVVEVNLDQTKLHTLRLIMRVAGGGLMLQTVNYAHLFNGEPDYDRR